MYNVHTVDEPSESLILPLYPVAEWAEPREAERTFIWEGEERTVSGFEVAGVLDEKEPELLSKDTDFADEDFWIFTIGTNTLIKLGYKVIFVEEELEDRQFLGFKNDDGHVLLLSALTEFEDTERLSCPCTYYFTVFTDDKRVLLK